MLDQRHASSSSFGWPAPSRPRYFTCNWVDSRMDRESTHFSIAARLTRFSQDSYRSAASFNGRPTASRSMAVTAMYAMSSVSGSPYPT